MTTPAGGGIASPAKQRASAADQGGVLIGPAINETPFGLPEFAAALPVFVLAS
jgi:hypothetical protein